jgi:hypothetical protein
MAREKAWLMAREKAWLMAREKVRLMAREKAKNGQREGRLALTVHFEQRVVLASTSERSAAVAHEFGYLLRLCLCVCMCVCKCMYMHMNVYMYMYTHTYVYTYTMSCLTSSKHTHRLPQPAAIAQNPITASCPTKLTCCRLSSRKQLMCTFSPRASFSFCAKSISRILTRACRG